MKAVLFCVSTLLLSVSSLAAIQIKCTGRTEIHLNFLENSGSSIVHFSMPGLELTLQREQIELSRPLFGKALQVRATEENELSFKSVEFYVPPPPNALTQQHIFATEIIVRQRFLNESMQINHYPVNCSASSI